jgi:signal transduction histidine kinase
MLAGLIAELDSATEAGEFYDDVCEALCLLTSMERAGLFLYDRATRAVRPVGSHAVDTARLGEVEGTLDETPIAQRALSEDRVVEAPGELAREIPVRYAGFAGVTSLACGPVAAGGRWLGVIFADAGGEPFDLTEQDRETILTLGRLAALAASVERATRQDERARRLNERIELTREIHERVMQRLFGLLLALGTGEPLEADEQRKCHDELQTVLGDLRSALGRPVSSHDGQPDLSLADLVSRRAERTPELDVAWPPAVTVPEHLEGLAQAVLLESLRNCEKHSRAEHIEVRVDRPGDAFELEITNDGAAGDTSGPGAGLGLRLLTMEALQHDALIEWGALPGDRWHVRLVGAAS